MPAIDFRDIGDVMEYDIREGEITSVDFSTDTCSVSVEGASYSALLFYHCTPSSTLRNNGAIEGAAGGFSVGDHVIVAHKMDGSRTLVLGHMDGPRKCGRWTFTFVDPLGYLDLLGEGNSPTVALYWYFKNDGGEWVSAYVDCSSSYVGGTLIVTPLFTTAGPVNIPQDTPLHVYIGAKKVTLRDFTGEEDYWENGAVPSGSYIFHYYGVIVNSSREGVGGDISKSLLPASGSVTGSFTTYGPAYTNRTCHMILSGFDVYGDDPSPGFYDPTEPVFLFGYGVTTGRILHHRCYVLGGSGPLGVSEGAPGYGIIVTITASPLAINNFHWINKTGTGYGDHDQDVIDILSGKPVWLDNSGYLSLGWYESGSTVSWEAIRAPADGGDSRRVRLYFDLNAYGYELGYSQNTYPKPE